jgi:hypothetical protein
MKGINFVGHSKRRKVAVQIDLKQHSSLWKDFRDGLIFESRRQEEGVSCQQGSLSRRG